ncbi:hypothetical protein RRG08_034901 [Elysia crispata]|uniref:Uncharacterized protein n=1 Tax=Elysia crispata TaxID=231223 RepID=A0AAE0YPL3_9GAST|nr:hypothetical protein RRG08_034901 [Elysia crispata]
MSRQETSGQAFYLFTCALYHNAFSNICPCPGLCMVLRVGASERRRYSLVFKGVWHTQGTDFRGDPTPQTLVWMRRGFNI